MNRLQSYNCYWNIILFISCSICEALTDHDTDSVVSTYNESYVFRDIARSAPRTYHDFYKAKLLESYSWTHASVKIGQCPCIRAHGSTACMGYDPSVMASSLSEAVYNFKMPTDDHADEEAPSSLVSNITGASGGIDPGQPLQSAPLPAGRGPNRAVTGRSRQTLWQKIESDTGCGSSILNSLLADTYTIPDPNTRGRALAEIEALRETYAKKTNQGGAACQK